MSSIRPPDGLWRVALRLADQRGVGLWLVGGAVRDALLLRRIHDWDFTVERGALSLARATANALGGAYYPLDADRGAGRVILPTGDSGTVTLDFADLRGDDLISDLRLRDFTVNAMALDADGELIDPLGGSVDLAAGHLRATSERAFSDDPVRTLRAVRQAAELGFSIDAQTEQWIRRDAARLAEPSRERVRDELVRLIALPGAALHVRRLDELDVLAHVLPPLAETQGVSQSWPHRFDVWEHSLHMLDALEGVVMACTGSGMPTPALAGPPPEVWVDVDARLRRFGLGIAEHLAATETGGRERGVLLKLAALLHDVGKPATQTRDEQGDIRFYGHEGVGAPLSLNLLQWLRFSSDECERVARMIGGHMRPGLLGREPAVTRRAIYRYFRDLGSAGVEVALMGLADHLSTWGPNLIPERWERRLDVVETLLEHYTVRRDETVAPPALLDGRDVMEALGVEPGPGVGSALEALREAQAAGEVMTREEALAFVRGLTA